MNREGVFSMTNEPKTTADRTYEQYEKSGHVNPNTVIPEDDIRDVDTITTQSISGRPLQNDVVLYRDIDIKDDMRENTITSENEESGSNELALEDIPDADDIQMNSPIDQAAPPIEIVHGTDLLNGYDGDIPEED